MGFVIGYHFLKVFSTHAEAVITSREIASVLRPFTRCKSFMHHRFQCFSPGRMLGRRSLRLSLVNPEGKHISCGLHFRADRLSTDSQWELPIQKTGRASLLWEKNRGTGSLFSLRRPLNLLLSSCQPPPLSHFWRAAGMPPSKVINDAVCSGAFLWACVGEPRLKLRISRVRARLSRTQRNHGHVT